MSEPTERPNEPTIVKTREVCPLCHGEWEAVCEVDPGATAPEEGTFTALGVLCPRCQRDKTREHEVRVNAGRKRPN